MVLLLWVTLMAMLIACGDNGNGGNDDTLLTGLSGVVIVGLVVWLVVRSMRKRG